MKIAKPQQQCPTCNADASDTFMVIHNGLNAEGKGFVHLAWGTTDQLRAQFSPKEMREHALRLLEAAEAAESDAAVFRMLGDRMQLDFNQRGAFVADLRNYRDDHYKKKE